MYLMEAITDNKESICKLTKDIHYKVNNWHGMGHFSRYMFLGNLKLLEVSFSASKPLN